MDGYIDTVREPNECGRTQVPSKRVLHSLVMTRVFGVARSSASVISQVTKPVSVPSNCVTVPPEAAFSNGKLQFRLRGTRSAIAGSERKHM